ncbi:MAG: TIGR02588 family protein [Acaryochloridaceae cyanobacterium RU_4_10]|jgi:uncharacterized protein (TIGR02588 family)|nr:TIGR02588 family protein [Acaryochloridaceae cyanobacterium RU_4_10]
MNTKSDSIQGQEQSRRSLAEWVTFSIAAAILSTVIGLVLYIWLGKQSQPPILSVTYEKTIRKSEGQFYVPFVLLNKGGETVESVRVVAKLKMSNGIEELGEQEIDFLSSGEVQNGAFVFSKDPKKGQINIRVTSYKLP